MRVVFMGTPLFAVPTLEALAAAGHEIAAVYTQPDRPKGRGQHLHASPVRVAADRLGLPVFQPERIRRPEVVSQLAAVAADVMVVVGYGQIIPQTIINIPPLGIVNVHASLLPRYRGAAPIQWAIANGDPTTGVTTMRINAGLDTGDMLLKAQTFIGPDETAPELAARLATVGAELLVETLKGLQAGTLKGEPQNNAEATYAPVLTRENGRVDWHLKASDIANRSRAFVPWPGVWTTFRGQILHIWRSKPANHISSGVLGSVCAMDRRVLVACGQGTTLELEELQLEGRKRVTAEAFRNGQRLSKTDILGENTN